MLQTIIKNWKTTSAGVVSIVSGILLFVNDKTKLIEALTARAVVSNEQGIVLADETANLSLPLNNGANTLFNYIVSGWNTTNTAVDIMKLDYMGCKFKANR